MNTLVLMNTTVEIEFYFVIVDAIQFDFRIELDFFIARRILVFDFRNDLIIRYVDRSFFGFRFSYEILIIGKRKN